MVETILQSRSPFGQAARSAPASGLPGLFVAERTGLGLATVIERRGAGAELAERLRSSHGIVLRPGPKVSGDGPLRFVGTGPGQWLAVAEEGGWQFGRDLARELEGIASVSDQSSGYGVLRLSGPRVRQTLAKGVPVDLHSAAFSTGDAASTLASHVGIVLWQVDDAPTYDVAVFRSFALSFRRWLEASAAEYGLA